MNTCRLCVWVLLLPWASIAGAQARHGSTVPQGQLLEEIRVHQTGTAVWWTGHNGWLIKSGGVLVGRSLQQHYHILDMGGRMDIR